MYYLGPEGTFTHEAATAFSNLYGLESTKLVPAQSVDRVIEAVSKADRDETALGVIPIENSIQGSVTTSWDAMGQLLRREHETARSVVDAASQLAMLQILAACRLRVTQNLLTAEPVSSLDVVTEVYSHPQALAQCRQWIMEHLPNAVVYSTDSTAFAAAQIDRHNQKTAAIASVAAAAHYGLYVQADGIQDTDNNVTRFALFGRPNPLLETALRRREGTRILSLLLTGVANCPGGLHQALTPFCSAELNLRRIESRPIGNDLGTYIFYVDIEWPASASASLWITLEEALVKLGIEVTNLGLYPETEV